MNQEDVEVFSKETFLTSVKRISDSATGNKSAQISNTNVIDEAPAMAIVRQKHAQLHDVVGSLSEKISSVLARQERDFLAAYRAHMYNVQKELHEMREKIHRNETVENKSEKIKKIEDERDWYRKEALRLDAFTTTMTKDLKYMKENLESIEEDRNWLEKQLKACKKQNKLLRAELDVRLAVPGNNSASDSTRVFPSFDRSGSKILKHRGSQELLTTAHGLPQLNLDVTSTSHEREEKLKKQIRTLKRELQHKSNELVAIKRQQRLLKRDESTGQSLLEQFFLQCVSSVKEEVSRRRDCRPSSVKGQRGGRLMEKARQPKFDVELDDFTPNDRVRLIERLLAHDEVLSFLYNQLFPTEKPAVNTDALEMNWTSQPSGQELQKREESLPTLHSSVSLPDTTSLFSNFDGSSNKSTKDGESDSVQSDTAVAAVHGSLPLDLFTKEYLKSV
ncbi:hypothetical protein F441_12139 [Phytophthora nicotianae CJ01A1]|uniref:Uncharacterized protein n=2 Tax=Phytophthora nicotianae TaxID=4792 RepID=W2IPZ6_PHYNI|nr:hypothetical protein L915_11885 [Phytophthora nicotianae]ETL36186.1 hypothetical protein L916_11813 [Phytophthora nicotianae]ETP12527.1 hypothetical protein F441_12139 [Phytophthora nicotianae CJ01A1]